jgi:cysteine desulfurase
MTPIYLDHAASTPVDPRVLEAMLPFFSTRPGNASSPFHAAGVAAREAVEAARRQVAHAVGAHADDVLFTASATEADNLALVGTSECEGDARRIVTAVTEHDAVLACCSALEHRGFEIVRLPVDSCGRLDLASLARALDPPTRLVSLMAGNNETGTLHPLADIGRIARERDVLFHSDAAQAAGKIPLSMEEAHVDLLTLSGHKIHGPKGVGALVVNARARRWLRPLLHGGGHEGGLRPGSHNVPGIVGLGKALEIAAGETRRESSRIAALRNRLEERLMTALAGVTVRGDRDRRLPHISSLTIEGVHAESLLLSCPEVAFSAGAACSSGTQEPSHVLVAMGLTPQEALSTIRFGLGRFTTEAEIDRAVAIVTAAVARLRRLAGS